jgi:glutaredoxin-related protein
LYFFFTTSSKGLYLSQYKNIQQESSLLSVLGIKEYSNWPTIPQVYFNGDFIGGCDLLLEMHKNGELVEELKNIGIKSALVDNKDDS